ncbi:MAG: hypothetical protein D6701_06490 [Gemmatimonadetes bacterium]|nr:MAG: hypothetical protein D6701_06490 [Gemmatimonadota bacterium]
MLYSRIPVLMVLLASLACNGSERAETADADTVPAAATAANTVRPGEEGVVLAGADTVTMGVVIIVRGADGSTQYGVFRGPPKLAEAVTGGTYEVRADSLHSRVYVLSEGERIEPAGRGG